MSWSPSDPRAHSAGAARGLRRFPLLPGAPIALWFAAVAVLCLGALARVPALDGLRADFVAARYAKKAIQMAERLPLRRGAAADAAMRAVEEAPRNGAVLRMASAALTAVEAYDDKLTVLGLEREIGLEASDEDLGTCYLMTGRTQEGLELLERAALRAMLELPATSDGLALRAAVLNNVAYVYAVAGVRLDRALQYATAAVAIRPLEATFLDTLGWVHYRLGQYEEAAFYLERAARLSLDSPHPVYYQHLGAVYARQGAAEAARRYLTRAAALDPENDEIRQELEMLRWRLPVPDIALTQEVLTQ